jgi:hypothetical protein
MCIARRPLCIIGATIDAIMARFATDGTADMTAITAMAAAVTGVTDRGWPRRVSVSNLDPVPTRA